MRKKLTFEELDELKKSASDFSAELKSSLDFSQTNTSSEGSIENSRIPSENSRIPSENSRVENSRIPSENSQNQVLDKLNSDPLNTKIDEQREGKNV